MCVASAISSALGKPSFTSPVITSFFGAMRFHLVRRDRLLLPRTRDLDVLRQSLHDLLHRPVYRLVPDQRVAVVLEIRRRLLELLQDRERDEGHYTSSPARSPASASASCFIGDCLITCCARSSAGRSTTPTVCW